MSQNREDQASLGSPAEKVPMEHTKVTPHSYEFGSLCQSAQSSPSTGSVAQRWFPALRASVQGCLIIFYVVAFVSAGSWSLQHQWAGYTVLMLSIAVCVVVILSQRSGIKSSALAFESSAKTTKYGLSGRIQRITGKALLILIGIAIISGWMYTLDFFWGLVWIEEVHSVTAYAATTLLFLHGAVVIYFKLRNDLPDRYRW